MNIQFLISELRAEGIPVTKAALKAKYDELKNWQDQLDAAIKAAEVLPAQDTAAHDAVESYLINLKNSNPAQFDIERKLSFDELTVKAGA